ncbi:ATP-binding protein [Pseudorhodoferax sp. Leaf274]|uniref:ATP-binding protein n=1 Tax=Pseudorhodoferax sp. Leaf274 TaxID=1736318 RepID=UPI000702C821|nr:ATP-binding protein [Pseudorhodoferax sp. Leaf274]KQP44660.1 histidine kinase [Pseudorhodoferax sp. Leaf274]
MPRLTLHAKVFAALTVLLAVLLLAFAAFSRIGLQQGLGPYVAEIELARMDGLAQRLAQHYRQNGGWAALQARPELWQELRWPAFGGMPRRGEPPPWPPDAARPDFGGDRPPPGRPPRGHPEDAPPDSPDRRLGLRDAQGRSVAGIDTRAADAALRPVLLDGAAVGTLVLAPARVQDSAADRALLRRHLGFMAATGLAGLALALLLSWWLTRRWLAPVHALAEGARAVAQGELSARVPVAGEAELARLATTFNDMVQRLEQADGSRRDWLADVAHELRTPLAAMRAEIEALQDGIRQFDDKAALRLHRQVMRLIQLVDDLRTSLETPRAGLRLGHVPAHPLALLAEALASMQERFAQAGLSIEATALLAAARAEAQPTVSADPRQLHQVFLNLLENSLRYTDAGGQLQVRHAVVHDAGRRWLELRFDDSPPGVAPAERERLFERLYRGEASRNRAHGGSGLGLAICRNLVLAHGGRIAAEDSALGGLAIVLRLPLLDPL